MNNAVSANGVQDIAVHVPMTFRRRSGRKEIIVPDDPHSRLDNESHRPDYHEALVIAISRAHRWLRLLHSGSYRSINEMASKLGVNNAYMRRLIRFTLLAPDIVVAVLDGNDPDGLSQSMLVRAIPMDWREQRRRCGLDDSRCPGYVQSSPSSELNGPVDPAEKTDGQSPASGNSRDGILNARHHKSRTVAHTGLARGDAGLP